MKAKFTGDPADAFSGPRVLRAFGRAFPKGRFVTLAGDDAEAVFAKLKANNHFETGEGDGDDDQTPLEPEITEAEIAGAGNAPAGGDSSADKAEIIAQLEALQAKHPEVEFDGRWGAPKLKAALEAAQFVHGDD